MADMFKSLLLSTFDQEVLWTVAPLILTTFIMLFYFQKYKDERPGWNTLVGNSLVLIFISAILLRKIYSIGSGGAMNFIEMPIQTFVTLFLFLIGFIILLFNFNHVFPQSFAEYISSPITINLLAYVIILYIYSGLENSWHLLLSLLLLYSLLLVVFEILKYPLRRLFFWMRKKKEKEEIEDVRKEQENLEKEKKEVKKKEKKLKEEKKKDLLNKEKNLKKVKKVVDGKPLKKSSNKKKNPKKKVAKKKSKTKKKS